LVETEGRAVWQVIASAFGPPGRVKIGRENAALAEMLWQTLAPRAQRRLKELLANDADTPFELVVERAKQSGRRVGMFLTGDFGHAARRVVGEFRKVDDDDSLAPGAGSASSARICRRSRTSSVSRYVPSTRMRAGTWRLRRRSAISHPMDRLCRR